MKILAWLAVAAALAGGPASAATESFKDWTVVCDNRASCDALGFTPEGEEMSGGFLRVRRAGGADAEPQAALFLPGDHRGPWRLSLDGRPIAGLLSPAPAGEADSYLTAPLPAALLPRLVAGGEVTVAGPQGTIGRISLAGSSAALRWMDARQGRAGGVTALVARGGTAASAVPPPPQLPAPRAASPAAQARLPRAIPAALAPQMADCDEDMAELGVEPVIARLAPGVVFYGLPCSRGAYNLIYRMVLADEQGRGARPAPVAYPGEDQPVEDLMNIEFDPKRQVLSNFDKARGLGDCGAFTEWVWTGAAFAATSQVLMPECRAVPPEFWPVSWRTADTVTGASAR